MESATSMVNTESGHDTSHTCPVTPINSLDQVSNTEDEMKEYSFSAMNSVPLLIVENESVLEAGIKIKQARYQEKIMPTLLTVKATDDEQILKIYASVTDTFFLPGVEVKANIQERCDKKKTWFQNFFVCCVGGEESHKEGIFS